MKVCLFDIDGTLIRTGGAGQQAFLAALAEEFGIREINGDVAFSGRTDRAIVRDFFTLQKINADAANWERFRAAYLRHLPAKLASCDGRVLPGIAELLEHLAARDDVAVGLLTGNISAGAEAKLGHYDLFHHFQFGGYGDEHTDRDDVARAAFQLARGRLPCDGRGTEAIVIGDTPHDVRCARAIGAVAVAVCTGFSSREELTASRPDYLYDDLRDFTRFVSDVIDAPTA